MNTDGTAFSTYKECHKTEFLSNHTTTDHKKGGQFEDRRNVGGSSCNSGDGTDKRVQSLMFMMMIIVLLKLLEKVDIRFRANGRLDAEFQDRCMSIYN